MAGPMTVVLNDDIKELKAEIKDFKAEFHHALDALKKEYHLLGVELAELRGELKVTFRIAGWAGALLVTTILTSGVAGLWWASRINAKVDISGERMDERFGAVDARFDRLEGLIIKALDQGRPAMQGKKSEAGADAPVR